MTSPVLVYNPLPAALAHYETELLSVLATTGREVVRVPVGSAELGSAGPADRLRAAGRDLRDRLRTSRMPGHVVVCWPVLGLVRTGAVGHGLPPDARDGARARPGAAASSGEGWGRAARTLGRLGSHRERVTVAVHSVPAARALRDIGWPDPVQLPHPIVARPLGLAADRDVVLVCGQYKPARDLRLLERLAAPLKSAGLRPVIKGRGWPDVPGWEVDEGFLAEEALDESLAASAAVLIPYAHFFQSGIAVRAVELGVPVVGPDHEFLVELLGRDWPGLVGDDDPEIWARATTEAIGLSAVARRRVVDLRASCEREWAAHLD